MNRLAQRFADCRKSQRRALVTYLMAGDPGPDATVPLLHALVDAGADILELGVPFSDPIADGPAIQAACERALAAGMNLTGTLALVTEFRRQDQATPIVLMGYLNPIEQMGYAEFAAAAAEAGVDGVLTVDVPPQEAQELVDCLRAMGLAPIFLLSPTTPMERMRQIAAQAEGFLYYVSLKGVTGAASLDVAAVAEQVARIRALTELPIGVGFGIGTPAAAAEIARLADAVVVGSALVNKVAHAQDLGFAQQEAAALVADLRAAMDAAVTPTR